MGKQETTEILKIIAEAQQMTAPVKLTIGTINGGQVFPGGVYIEDCAASVIQALIDADYVLSMDGGRLHPLYQKRGRK